MKWQLSQNRMQSEGEGVERGLLRDVGFDQLLKSLKQEATIQSQPEQESARTSPFIERKKSFTMKFGTVPQQLLTAHSFYRIILDILYTACNRPTFEMMASLHSLSPTSFSFFFLSSEETKCRGTVT